MYEESTAAVRKHALMSLWQLIRVVDEDPDGMISGSPYATAGVVGRAVANTPSAVRDAGAAGAECVGAHPERRRQPGERVPLRGSGSLSSRTTAQSRGDRVHDSGTAGTTREGVRHGRAMGGARFVPWQTGRRGAPARRNARTGRSLGRPDGGLAVSADRRRGHGAGSRDRIGVLRRCLAGGGPGDSWLLATQRPGGSWGRVASHRGGDGVRGARAVRLCEPVGRAFGGPCIAPVSHFSCRLL